MVTGAEVVGAVVVGFFAVVPELPCVADVVTFSVVVVVAAVVVETFEVKSQTVVVVVSVVA